MSLFINTIRLSYSIISYSLFHRPTYDTNTLHSTRLPLQTPWILHPTPTPSLFVSGRMAKGGNRGSSAPKKAPVLTSTEDDSYIVFGNASSTKRPKNVEQNPSATGQGLNNLEPSGENAPKKPDTRKLIGGASWTGKLPVNMLSEHCQKQKWTKPEYTMVSTSHLPRYRLIS